MSEQLPGPSEPDHLARHGATFNGSVPVSGMARLSAELHSAVGVLSYRLAFTMEGRTPVLRGTLEGEVELVCQRCLEPMKWPLSVTLAVGFIDSDWAETQLPDDLEGVRVDPEERLLLSRLLEDEALLALPLIPRHAPEQCVDLAALTAGGALEATESGADAQGAAAERENPFAVLATLKKGSDTQT